MSKRYTTRYAAAGTSPELKEYRAELAVQLKRRGVSVETFLEASNATSFQVGRATLYKHIKAIEEGEAPLSAEKKGGRPGKLTDKQWDVVAGAILVEVEKVDLQWVITWIEANLGVVLSLGTMSRHLDELDLCFRLTGGRLMPKLMTEESYVNEYYNCVLTLRNDGFFDWDPKKIVAVDCCTNSRRLERIRTISMV
jgi:transposase